MEGHPDEHFPGNEAGDTNGDGQCIADKACPVPEAYFDLERLTANGAVFVHLHHMPEIIGVMMDVKIALAATGAFIGQDAAEQAGPMIVGIRERQAACMGPPGSLSTHIIIDFRRHYKGSRPQGVQGCANEGLNGIIYLFFFFEVDGPEPVLPLAGAGANLPVFTGTFLARTVLACEAAVVRFSAANR